MVDPEGRSFVSINTRELAEGNRRLKCLTRNAGAYCYSYYCRCAFRCNQIAGNWKGVGLAIRNFKKSTSGQDEIDVTPKKKQDDEVKSGEDKNKGD